MSSSTSTDIVSLSALHLTTTVGPDHWHRTRPQPIHLTLHLHLSPSYLTTPGQSDNVTDSLHYGHLAQSVQRRIGNSNNTKRADGGPGGYASPRALADDVTDAAFEFVRDVITVPGPVGSAAHSQATAVAEVIHAVRIVLELPKQILLASGFEIELVTRASDWLLRSTSTTGAAIVRVKNLILPVLIGVNPPERLAKQRVITHLTFFESVRPSTDVPEDSPKEIDYPSIVQQIVTASRCLKSDPI